MRAQINWRKAINLKYDFEKECWVSRNASELYEILTAAFIVDRED